MVDVIILLQFSVFYGAAQDTVTAALFLLRF